MGFFKQILVKNGNKTLLLFHIYANVTGCVCLSSERNTETHLLLTTLSASLCYSDSAGVRVLKKKFKRPREITCSAPNKQLDTIGDSRLITAARSASRGADIWLSAVDRSQAQLKWNKCWTNIHQMPRSCIPTECECYVVKYATERTCHLSPNQMLQNVVF